MLSSSDSMIDAVPLLMLSECLDQCRNNDSCSAVNYETGLCVLFTKDADKLPGRDHIHHSDQLELFIDIAFEAFLFKQGK